MKVNKRLRHFHDSPTPSEILAIEGELYECVCYEKIVNKYQNIKFIRLNENRHKKDGFYISSAFAWYKPSKKVKDSDLTEEELKLIERIKNFETRDENKKNVNLKSIEGIWQDYFIMADGWSNRFLRIQIVNIKILIIRLTYTRTAYIINL